MRIAAIPFSLTTLLLGGCVLALPGYNEPFEERIAVIADNPASYTVRIEGTPGVSIPVAADGRVKVTFPVLPRQCSTYLLAIKVRDRSITARELILIAQGDRVVKRMSVNRLRNLPSDSRGYHQVRVR